MCCLSGMSLPFTTGTITALAKALRDIISVNYDDREREEDRRNFRI